jgi:AcrR family transcriptional regulator
MAFLLGFSLEEDSAQIDDLMSRVMARTTTTRRYDARRRRERAEEERRATRRRVVDAARQLFLTKGYVATTMADVAREAGVALQSVYTAGKSKADLLHLVTDRAVAGDDEEVMLLQRPTFAAIADEPRPEQQVRMMAAVIAGTLERLAPVWVAYREAAAVDPKAAANLVAAHRRRHETFAGMVAMLPEHRLRYSPEDSTDTTWAIGSIDVFLLLRSIRDWDAGQYADWLSRTLVDQLLSPAD